MLREPLVQFPIGLVLLIINGALNHGTNQAGSSTRSRSRLTTFAVLQSTFAAPAHARLEMRGLVEIESGKKFCTVRR